MSRYFSYFIGSKRLKNYRKQLFTVLWNLRVKSTQFLCNFLVFFNNKPIKTRTIYNKPNWNTGVGWPSPSSRFYTEPNYFVWEHYRQYSKDKWIAKWIRWHLDYQGWYSALALYKPRLWVSRPTRTCSTLDADFSW